MYLRVIVLADFSDCYEGTGVLVGLEGVEIMEGSRVRRFLVAEGEIYPHCEVDLTATHHIVKEGVQFTAL